MIPKRTLTAIAILFSVLTLAGCATTRAKKPDPVTEANNQITQLHAEIESKDRQIQELQGRVDSYERAMSSSAFTTNVTPQGGGIVRSSIVKVAGVSVADVQRALARAGFDPGPADGKAGKKTKSAIRQFQRSNGLGADGVVGSRTWAALNA